MPEPDRGKTPGKAASALKEVAQAGSVVAVLAGLALWWMFRSDSPDRSKRVPASPAKAVAGIDYVGAKVCRECHAREDALQRRSGHSRTLALAADQPIAARLNVRTASDPEFPEAVWNYLLRDRRLTAERTAAGLRDAYPQRFALGSGTHAVTFVDLEGTDSEGRPTSLEHRLTYFTDRDALDITPGQSLKENDPGRRPEGRRLTAENTMKCFGCHATRLSTADERTVDPATLMPNVSCERCHGPGRSHVEAARRNDDTALAMPFGYAAAESAELNIRLCGQCHRLPEHVPAAQRRADNAKLARFQPVGLMQSKCYTSSPGTLSCSTCHDPHAKTLRDRVAYEAVCLNCHASKPQTACPVSPRENCLTCHMPRRDSGNGLEFSDHWIRINHDIK